MTLEEIKEPIGTLIIDSGLGEMTQDGLYLQYVDVITMMRKYSEAQLKESNWISVKDRLPEITMNTMSDWVLTFDKVACRIDKAFFSRLTGWSAEHEEEMDVRYWMPLPDTPK